VYRAIDNTPSISIDSCSEFSANVSDSETSVREMDAYASIKIRLKVHLAFGYTDMRKGIDGLAMLVQGVLLLPTEQHMRRYPIAQALIVPPTSVMNSRRFTRSPRRRGRVPSVVPQRQALWRS
jgi:hypothetical protein